MKRREFMETAAALALGVAWSATLSPAQAGETAFGVIDAGTGEETAMLADHLFQAFPKPASLQVIGKAYRRERADSASSCWRCMPDAFEGFLRHLDLSKADLQSMTAATLRTHIDSRTARDFAEGKIITVEGWLLGETEARLCEVAALHRA
ncbi:MAG: hypothetical protein AAGC99_19920 [Pseudomonadota bacterium]